MSERIIYGINTVRQALNKNSSQLLRIYLQNELGQQRLARLADELRGRSIVIEQVSADELLLLTGSPKHQGVAAALEASGPLDEHTALDYLAGISNPLILVLDGIEDPRNYGACLRTAEGAGADLVVTGRSRGVNITPVVSKVASGAAETQPIARVANVVRFLKGLQTLNIWIVGAAEGGSKTIFDSNLAGPVALVMGAEGKGLRRLTREHCDAIVSLPMRGAVESLNISVAAGICLYEAVRQRS
ncbi:MAG: 23S rRNA (guanosine(2251)-2'-O)-methyltransferase RlmB [Gammaproteobacteria bacterium]|nr:MAG: 23S rRNA (guanosine(2251)-2'-O)-methyltransferase RlmB [Gammaproteobacteria bacterium]